MRSPFPFFHLELPVFFESRQGNILTILAWVQAERGSFQHSGVLADVPDVKVYKYRDRGEGGHSEPSQHENVCQHDKLQRKTKNHRLLGRLLSFAWALSASNLYYYCFCLQRIFKGSGRGFKLASLRITYDLFR